MYINIDVFKYPNIHKCIIMASKTITVTVEAYEALKAAKDRSESFSEAIMRVVGRRSLKEFVGTLSEGSAVGLERAVASARKRHASERKRRTRKVAEGLRAG